MEFRQVRHLIAIAEHGSYARAAEALGVSQSALTQSIAKLEGDLGVRLFDRGRFGASETEAGRLLLARARLIDAEARQARQELEAFRGGRRGDVRLGVGKSLVQGLVPEAIARFARMRPDIVVSAYEGISGDLFRRLLKGELDFVVSAPTPALQIDPELTQRTLFDQHEMVIVGHRHPLARRTDISLADLTDHHWIVTPQGMGRVSYLRSLFSAAGLVPPRRFIRTDSAVLMERLVELGAGLGMATAELLDNASGRFAAIDMPQFSEVRRVCVTKRRRSRLPPLAAALEAQIIRLAEERQA